MTRIRTVTIIVTVTLIILLMYWYFVFKRKETFITEDTYDIQEFENFLTSEECDVIIQLAEPHLFDSTVYSDTEDLLDHNSRKSKQHWLRDHEHDIVKKISLKVAELTNTSLSKQEPLQVVKYEEGGYFYPHRDACEGSKEYCQRMDEGGKRFVTLLIYLNDDFTGGETEFPLINKKCIPKKGKAVLFYNVDMDGNVLQKSLHGANTIQSGTKWVCNKWIKF